MRRQYAYGLLTQVSSWGWLGWAGMAGLGWWQQSNLGQLYNMSRVAARHQHQLQLQPRELYGLFVDHYFCCWTLGSRDRGGGGQRGGDIGQFWSGVNQEED